MTQLADVTIRLDGEEYRLARQATTEAVKGPSARRWSVEKLPIATKRQPRANVRPGDIPGEYVITYDDWSKGITGDHSPIPGTLAYCSGFDPSVKGALRELGFPYTLDIGTPGAPPCAILLFAGTLFVIAGRYVYRVDNNKSTLDVDFGEGVYATDAIVHNNYLVVAFGSSGTNYIRKRDTAGNWTTDDDVLADYFTVVEGRLWRAVNTNEISNIAPTDDPFTATNWSSPLTIGDDDVPITDLNAYGEKVAVSKEDGLYLGDASAIFPNVLSHIASISDEDNGKGTLVMGSRIFYPYKPGGCVLYENGSATEIGLAGQIGPLNTAFIPGYNIAAMAAQGSYVWAITEPVYQPRALPVGLLVTTDNEITFTSHLADATDSDDTSLFELDSLGKAADGDYFYIGYTAPFYGFYADICEPNGNAATLTVEYWDGDSWEPFAGAFVPHDLTALGGVTLAQSGAVVWGSKAYALPARWEAKEINDTLAYWVRCSVSAALDNATSMRELRVLTALPTATVYRARPRRPDDVFQQAYIWEMFARESMATPCRTVLVVGPQYDPYRAAHTLLAAEGSTGRLYQFPLNVGALEGPITTKSAGDVWLARDDAGMPQVNKQWLDITVKGQTISSASAYKLYYRLNEDETWTTVSTNSTSSPKRHSLNNVTGYALQVGLAGRSNYNREVPVEINEIEVRFRVLDTYKKQYTMLLELADSQYGQNGNPLPEASVQLAALEALLGAGTKTLYPPVGSSKSVTVDSVRVVEYLQEATEYPVVLVEVVCTEV